MRREKEPPRLPLGLYSTDGEAKEALETRFGPQNIGTFEEVVPLGSDEGAGDWLWRKGEFLRRSGNVAIIADSLEGASLATTAIAFLLRGEIQKLFLFRIDPSQLFEGAYPDERDRLETLQGEGALVISRDFAPEIIDL